MRVREEEKLGSAETARLKREAREAKRQRALKLAEEGMRPAEIGTALGIDGGTVAEWLRSDGVRYVTRESGALALL